MTEIRQRVQVMGQYVSGDYREVMVDASGELKIEATAEVSGQPVTISGDHVFVESGVFLASGQGGGTPEVMSGQHVMISGQHVFVESGVHVLISGQAGAYSGSYGTTEIACADVGRTAGLVQVVGGSSGTYVGASSGGISLCVSGYWCSGPVHQLRVKNMDGNENVFVGFSGCPPYSGWGYVLGGNDEIPLDMCNPCDVHVVGNISGQTVCWIGTDY